MVIACEDVGLAYPQVIPIVKACVDAANMLGLPEARIPLGDAAVLMATAPKSNSAHLALDAAMADVRAAGRGIIPVTYRTFMRIPPAWSGNRATCIPITSRITM